MNKDTPVEVLYHPRTNKIALFSGEFRFDKKRKIVYIILKTDVISKTRVDVNELVHLGWL